MSDNDETKFESTDNDASFARFMLEHDEYRKRAAELDAANKKIVLDALAAHGVSQVLVAFDGYGDSGQIVSIDAWAGENPVDLHPISVMIDVAEWRQPVPTSTTMSVSEAIEHLAYSFLQQTHSGWENNDGAYGEFTFYVPDRTVMLDYNGRYTASKNFNHEF